ncbi:MAG: hypothetical protein NC203_03310 [Firmicutes bacterium]|nr:hypothetical protein [Bacillota bacterium]
MKKSVKIPLIILSVILALILLAAIALGGVFLYSGLIIFDHRDCTINSASIEFNDSYSLVYPFFGNPIVLSGSDGPTYATNSISRKSVPVYDAVNSPMYMWKDYLCSRYKKCVNLNYVMEQNDKTISVSFSGNAKDDEGNTVPLEQKFVFDIENASPDKLPEWINRGEMNDDYKEYLDYIQSRIDDPKNAVMPEWLAEQSQEQ